VLTGVIYGAIVVAWAAYLVPLALRRHDEASRSRSIERFSSAMRVLARRGSGPDLAAAGGGLASGERVVLAPKRRDRRVLPPEPAPRPEPERMLITPPRNRAAERAAAARRRRVLSMLVTVTVVVGLAALVGLAPRWWVGVPVLLIVGFLVVARFSVRRATKPYWVEAPAPEQSSAVVVRRSPVRVDAGREDGDDVEDDPADEEPTIALTPAQRAKAAGRSFRPRVAVSATSPDGGSLWDPVPVTLPTYVSAPPAPRTVRTVDLGRPNGRPAAKSVEPAADAPAADAPTAASPADLDEVEVPRVVNG
jgi:hypothetical protein